MPVIYIYAINTTAGKDSKLYECPIYRKPARTDLNYIGSIDFESDIGPRHWTMRGVALLCDIKQNYFDIVIIATKICQQHSVLQIAYYKYQTIQQIIKLNKNNIIRQYLYVQIKNETIFLCSYKNIVITRILILFQYTIQCVELKLNTIMRFTCSQKL